MFFRSARVCLYLNLSGSNLKEDFKHTSSILQAYIQYSSRRIQAYFEHTSSAGLQEHYIWYFESNSQSQKYSSSCLCGRREQAAE